MKNRKMLLFVFVGMLQGCFARRNVPIYSGICGAYAPFVIIGSNKDTQKTMKEIDDWNSFIIEACPKSFEELYFKTYH